MINGHYIEAVEIIRRLEGGMTRPFLCRASDEKYYVVKGLELPPFERLAELLCARLAAAFGLPVPEHGVIYIDQGLTRYFPEARSSLGEGDCFALGYLHDASDLVFSQIGQIPIELQQAVYVFDYWVGNSDRQLTCYGGRPNLMMKADGTLSLIDHNQAFQWPVNAEEFIASHTFGPANRSWRLDLVSRVEYQQRIDDTAVRFNELCSDIPEQWREASGDAALSEQLRLIESNLLRYRTDDFWGVLE